MQARTLVLILAFLLSGCSLTGYTPPAPAPETLTPAPIVSLVLTATPTLEYKIVCRCEYLNIRQNPGDGELVLGGLVRGNSVRVTGRQVGPWVEISPSGWVHGAYLCSE